MGDLVDLRSNALEDVCGTVDDGVEQIHQNAFAADLGGARTSKLVFDDGEWSWIVIAHGYKTMTRDNKRDRSGLRSGRIRLAHERGRHVSRAVLHIESARDLDLLHLFAGRNGDAHQLLNRPVFLHTRCDHIDPHRIFRNCCPILDVDTLERRPLWHVDRKHPITILRMIWPKSYRGRVYLSCPDRAE